MDDVYSKSDRPVSKSAFFVKWVNALAVALSLAVISLGIWLATRPGDCEKYLTVPVFLIGALFLLISVLGLFGSWFAIVHILYSYLVLMFAVLLAFLIFIIFIFVVTSPGSGYNVTGLDFQEYNINNYSSYVQGKLNKQSNWNHVKACLEASDNCANFETISPGDYPYANLNSIQSGCCRPPAECGYALTSAGTFANGTASSSNPDCLKYSNDASVRCYDCDSCKGGVAQDIQKTGRIAGIFSLVLFFILIVVYVVACFVGHNASRKHYGRV